MIPSRKSFISKVWINDKKAKSKIAFFIPELCDIKYVCVNNIDFNINSKLFQTKEEFELAKAIAKNYDLLSLSRKQTHDIKILEVNKNHVNEKIAINIKNIKNGSNEYCYVFSDIFKGIINYKQNKNLNFLILNKEWNKYSYFKNFTDIDIIRFSKEMGVKIIFADYNNKD